MHGSLVSGTLLRASSNLATTLDGLGKKRSGASHNRWCERFVQLGMVKPLLLSHSCDQRT